MAALGKIRSKGVALVCVIGLGLFAFIAEEAFRSCKSTRNDHRQQIGEVLGKKINVQEYQKLVDEYVEIIKLQRGDQGLNDTELDRYRDYVWQTYVSNAIVAEKDFSVYEILIDADRKSWRTDNYRNLELKHNIDSAMRRGSLKKSSNHY